MNGIRKLEELGQSAWLDFLDRRLLSSGELDQLIVQGVRGVTSNPTIFQKAIVGASDYDEVIRTAPRSESDQRVLERLMVRDLTVACDVLRPVYEATAGADGFASIEVAPSLAEDAPASVEQALRLWNEVDRPNLLVKIPGTRAALPAIKSCLCHGINVNITLLFSEPRYREVAEVYLQALEARVAQRAPIDRVASVASFFVSRVDTKVDRLLDELTGSRRSEGGALRGQIAIANARIAYEEYERILASPRWKRLAAMGARPQRVLWASTSPKDPAYAELYYVGALALPHTVDTMTLGCLRACIDHFVPEVGASAMTPTSAHDRMDRLMSLGIDFGFIAEELESEGIASFADSYTKTMKSVAEKRRASAGASVARA